MKKKIVAACLVICLLATAVIGTTLAYFTDTTDTVKNTFTVGNVDIDLKETTGENYKMIPGTQLDKNPKVTVKAGSEDCYVFVKVEESNLAEYIEYTVDSGWNKLTGVEGVDNVWYREAEDNTADSTWSVLTGDKVTVKTTVEELPEGVKPTLSFTAYAIQMASFDGYPAAAWAAGAWN